MILNRPSETKEVSFAGKHRKGYACTGSMKCFDC